MPYALQDLYKRLRESLSEADSRYVLQKRAQLDTSALIAAPQQEISDDIAEQIEGDLAAHKAGKPLSRIYGEREFWGLNFKLSSATLDPRADTETLIEAVLRRFEGQAPPKTILDLGTGSGCILLALLSEFKDSQGLGVDIAPEAVQTAQENAKRLALADRAEFMCSSWADDIENQFDLVVSNPPYIASDVILKLDENVQNYDPIQALDGGENGLQAYENIFSTLSRCLKKGGAAFFEIGFDQEKSTRRLSEESGFLVQSVHRDSAGNPRVVEIFFS